jgi:hypothetical protein
MFDWLAWRRTAGFLTLAVVMTGLPRSAEAQRRIQPVDSLREIQSISPRSGPIGTRVEIYSDNMPLEATYHVGVGATRSGFESLYEATQLDLGTISVTLPIPEEVGWDRAIVFVAFNAIFSPIAMSKPFHVTDGDGRIQRTGTVTRTAGPCATFRDLDRFDYELTGETGGLEIGQEAVISAEYLGESDCVDGAVIRVLGVSSP